MTPLLLYVIDIYQTQTKAYPLQIPLNATNAGHIPWFVWPLNQVKNEAKNRNFKCANAVYNLSIIVHRDQIIIGVKDEDFRK